MFCSSCGSPNDNGATFCQKCGKALSSDSSTSQSHERGDERMRDTQSPQSSSATATGKNPVLAAILSLIPGVGQFYNGDVKKGWIMLGITVVGNIVTLGWAWLPMFIWAAYDAYQVASGKGKKW